MNSQKKRIIDYCRAFETGDGSIKVNIEMDFTVNGLGDEEAGLRSHF